MCENTLQHVSKISFLLNFGKSKTKKLEKENYEDNFSEMKSMFLDHFLK